MDNTNYIKILNGEVQYITSENDNVQKCSISEYIEKMVEEKSKNFSHNLKIECAELIPYLLRNGFKNNPKYRLKEKQFKKVEGEDGSIFSITIYYKKANICFFDSMKILNFSVDHLKNKFLNINEEMEELIVVKKSIEEMLKRGYTKNTMSSNAYSYWKKQLIENKKISKTKFENLLPQLPIEVDDFVRKSYKGGWTFLNKKYNKEKSSGYTLDVNSLYPSVMYNSLMPWGEPIEFKGKYKKDKEYPLFIQAVKFDYITLKKNKFPCANGKGIGQLIENKYIEKESNITMYITNIDLELIKECYDYGNITYGRGYKFRATKELFKDYINHFMDIKMKQKGIEREISKLFLNSLYGKFASRVRRPIYETKLDEDGVEVRDIIEYEKNGRMYYTPLSCFISSYSRAYTIRAANKNFKYFIYSDTDSIHLNCKSLRKIKGMKIDDKKLGYWKVEKIFSDSVFIGSKCYGEKDKNGWEFKVAGLPKTACENIKDKSQFYKGAVIECDIIVKSKNGTEKIKRKFEIGANVIGEIF